MSDQVNPAFNHYSNIRKVALNLLGILSGISADAQMNQNEIAFLYNWLRDQTNVKKTGDLLDLQDAVEDILLDGVVTEEEREDIMGLIDTVLQYSEVEVESIDCLVNRFLGFLTGISCDDELTDSEIRSLHKLIEAEPSAHSHWAISKIKHKVDEVLEDGVITVEERASLLQEVKSVCGQQFLDTGIASGLSTEALSGDVEVDTIDGLSVCFTGTFTSGKRADVAKTARESGANVLKGITQKLDVLVIGGIASRDWKFSSFGRKVESVHANREKGASTIIIDEPTWLGLLASKSA